MRTQAGTVLKNVFMHLLRNAVDHGIETAEVRQLEGKPAHGTIRLVMDVDSGMLRIALSDDGRGLGLNRIRSIAQQKGLITANGQHDDEAIARLIFEPGFSTSTHVTEVSGGGVGMDAVMNFISREQGRIDIVFTDDLEGADYRRFNMIVSLPDSFAVKSGWSGPVDLAEDIKKNALVIDAAHRKADTELLKAVL